MQFESCATNLFHHLLIICIHIHIRVIRASLRLYGMKCTTISLRWERNYCNSLNHGTGVKVRILKIIPNTSAHSKSYLSLLLFKSFWDILSLWDATPSPLYYDNVKPKCQWDEAGFQISWIKVEIDIRQQRCPFPSSLASPN